MNIYTKMANQIYEPYVTGTYLQGLEDQYEAENQPEETPTNVDYPVTNQPAAQIYSPRQSSGPSFGTSALSGLGPIAKSLWSSIFGNTDFFSGGNLASMGIGALANILSSRADNPVIPWMGGQIAQAGDMLFNPANYANPTMMGFGQAIYNQMNAPQLKGIGGIAQGIVGSIPLLNTFAAMAGSAFGEDTTEIPLYDPTGRGYVPTRVSKLFTETPALAGMYNAGAISGKILNDLSTEYGIGPLGSHVVDLTPTGYDMYGTPIGAGTGYDEAAKKFYSDYANYTYSGQNYRTPGVDYSYFESQYPSPGLFDLALSRMTPEERRMIDEGVGWSDWWNGPYAIDNPNNMIAQGLAGTALGAAG